MKKEGENTSGSSQQASAARPLHDCACCFLSLLKRTLNHMPFPISHVIQTVDRWTHPLTLSLERHGLCILAAFDDKISTMGFVAEECIFSTATQAKEVLSLLHKQGIIGTSAYLWLKYEEVVKEEIQNAVYLAKRIPLLNCVTPAVCAVSSPLAIAVSDWISKQAARWLEKGEHMVANSNLVIAKQEVDIQSPNTALESPKCIGRTSMIAHGVDDVHSGSADDFVKPPLGKDMSATDVVGEETSSVHHDMVDDNAHFAPSSLATVDVDDGLRAAGKNPENRLLSVPERGDDSQDVLEMIESSWLLGHTSSGPPQTRKTSGHRADDFLIRIKTFFSG